MDELKAFANPAAKIRRLVDKGELFPVVRGLYETDKNTPGHCLASSIYGPSYLSFEFALAHHSLIPEAVYAFTCATFEKKKSKQYDTAFGTFTFRDVPSGAYPYGVVLRMENGYSVALATPEKALCDQLYTIPPVPNTKELLRLLTENLRIEETELRKLDAGRICEYSGAYHTTNIKKLCSLLRRI